MTNHSPSACIELKEGTHIAPVVLMPGDPLRAKFVAEHYLEDPVLFNDVRITSSASRRSSASARPAASATT